MSNADFNEEAVRPKYAFRKDAANPKSFWILQWSDAVSDYAPFGEYVVVDAEESENLSEKRVANLVGALNEKRRLEDLSDETKSRTLYHVTPEKDADGRSKVVFRTFTGEGVSKENALFTFEGDVE
ncbi:MAG: hypothetical protein EOM26_00540 [Alphaproteobacteria bacterium]|nr:hypothetical protein [Alphaproteobacteria bacterium]